jgi:hypothetical protein
MSDLSKKSQDIDSLTDEIETKSGEIDSQIGVLETKRKEMDDLEDRSESIFENLSGIEGEALEIAQANNKIDIASILCSSVGYTMPSIRDVMSGKPASSLFEKKDTKDRVEEAVDQRIEYMKDEEEKRKRRVKREMDASTRSANEAKIPSF